MQIKKVMLVAPPANAQISKWLHKNISHLNVLRSCYFGNKCQSFIGENLGLHSIAAYLSQFDIEVQVLDACLHELSIETVCQEIIRIQPNVVAFSIMEETIDEVATICHTLREIGFENQLIAGGPIAILAPKFVNTRIPELNKVVEGDLDELVSILGLNDRAF